MLQLLYKILQKLLNQLAKFFRGVKLGERKVLFFFSKEELLCVEYTLKTIHSNMQSLKKYSHQT